MGELLKEVSPETHKVALLFNPSTAPTAGEYFLPSFQDAARSLGMEAIPSPVHNTEEIESTWLRSPGSRVADL